MRSKDMIGRRVGEFTIQEPIGRGGMAEVYRAYQPSVNRDVALKIIALDQSSHDDEFRRRFAQEAEVIAKLEHIHILPIYGYGIETDIAYLAMRLLRGGSLSDLLREGPIPMPQAVELFTQIARGLAYAHSKGVIHRDLKPSNILMDDSGNAYLTDFGLAKIVGGEVDLTKSGNIVGTPAYMSPEQLRGERLDHRSDIYSLGVVLYHMLTGSPPFDATLSDVVSVIYKHLEKPPPAPSSINPQIPPEVEAVILKALSKDREQRFENAGEMANELKKAVGLSTLTTPFPNVSPVLQHGSQPTQPAIPVRSYYGLVGVGVLLMLVILVALFLLVTRPLPPAVDEVTITPPQATVMPGKWGSIESSAPVAAEIQTAQKVLGREGFIALVACNQSSEYHSALAREMGDFARQYGVALRVYDSNNDNYQQLTLIEKARTEGARALIICPLNAPLLDTTLKSVQKADMPLVLLSSDMPSYGGVLLEGDDFSMGLAPGRFAGQIIRDEVGGKANVIILDYPDLPYLVQRANGLEEGLRELAPQAKVIGRYKGATRDFGKASVSKLIADGVKFNVILSINDAGSFGAIDALEAAGITPDQVFIASVDAEALARQYIQQGRYIRGSLETGRTQVSQAAVNVAIKLLAGANVPERYLIPPGEIVTKDVLAQLDATATAAASATP
jgi:serine/threonine protein kinase/DNA-binding LacI/PurR family transcriptional regulator